ncbi:hypothetical protein [Methanolapillus africanus]
MFLGKIILCENEDGFEHSMIMEFEPNDSSQKTQISVAFNFFVIDKLSEIAENIQKNKSYVVRIAVHDFINYCENNEETIRYPTQKKTDSEMPTTRMELKEIMREILEEIKIKE